ncbi:hypothetical protein RUMOBE_00675 [Blautia obeum ATCC 29174]|uniref:Uncharacterized protein n=1 Tax=Blautia obeum ATCC 29174 TaxID=411459 RepID=A5ZNV8_9FIRM|nr:hypothetical protein RUMOBE_00675 [Blautia obeum ATCC 29174]
MFISILFRDINRRTDPEKTIHNKALMSLHISTKMKIKLQMIKMNW